MNNKFVWEVVSNKLVWNKAKKSRLFQNSNLLNYRSSHAKVFF